MVERKALAAMASLPLIREAGENDRESVASVLAEAFQNDPMMNWAHPSGENLEAYFKHQLSSIYLPHDEVYLSEDGLGAAMWLPPGTSPLRFFSGLTLAWKIVRMSSMAGLRRALKIVAATEKAHPVDPHYYLHAIGTRFSGRGRGLGAALMRRVLDKADAAQMPVYLENSNEANLGFYQKHGFTIRDTVCPQKGAPCFWLMWREANGPASN